VTDLLRPAVRDALWRWREVLVAVVVALLGWWWIATFFDPVRWIGWVILALAIVIAAAGVQRARFRQPGSGPGVVQVVEGRVAYFGPLTGGALDTSAITKLELEPQAKPAHWIVTGEDGTQLEVPVNARGADELFDVFAKLPGIETQKMLDALSRRPDVRVTVWQRSRPLLH